MSHPLPQESHLIVDGPTDPNAIRNYLNLKDGSKIATLAALMAQPSKKFDAPALVDAAMELLIEAEAELARRRETMVNSMNYQTLIELAEKLDACDGALPLWIDDYNEKLNDPVAGPVLNRLRQCASWRSDQSKAHRSKNASDALVAAKGRTDIPRPSLPCNLEQTLRYATNDKSLSWSVLEKAFIDYLSTLNDWESRDTDDEKELQQAVSFHVKVVTGQIEFESGHPSILASLEEHELKLKTLQSRLTTLQEDRQYRENFRPSVSKPPSHIEKEARTCYADHWQRPGCVKEESTLTSLANEFHTFWQKHGKEYIRMHTAAEHQKKALSAQTAKAGKQGVHNRERARWIKHTNNFIDYLNKTQRCSDLNMILVSADEFSTRYSGLTDPEAKSRVKEFLGALCNAAVSGRDSESVLEPLRNLRVNEFKNLPIQEQNLKITKMTVSDANALKKGDIPKCLASFTVLTIEIVDDCRKLLNTALEKARKK